MLGSPDWSASCCPWAHATSFAFAARVDCFPGHRLQLRSEPGGTGWLGWPGGGRNGYRRLRNRRLRQRSRRRDRRQQRAGRRRRCRRALLERGRLQRRRHLRCPGHALVRRRVRRHSAPVHQRHRLLDRRRRAFDLRAGPLRLPSRPGVRPGLHDGLRLRGRTGLREQSPLPGDRLHLEFQQLPRQLQLQRQRRDRWRLRAKELPDRFAVLRRLRRRTLLPVAWNLPPGASLASGLTLLLKTTAFAHPASRRAGGEDTCGWWPRTSEQQSLGPGPGHGRKGPPRDSRTRRRRIRRGPAPAARQPAPRVHQPLRRALVRGSRRFGAPARPARRRQAPYSSEGGLIPDGLSRYAG